MRRRLSSFDRLERLKAAFADHPEQRFEMMRKSDKPFLIMLMRSRAILPNDVSALSGTYYSLSMTGMVTSTCRHVDIGASAPVLIVL